MVTGAGPSKVVATTRGALLAGYRGLPDAGIRHRPEVIGDPKRASKRFPKVHRVASLLKRVILGTYQGRQSRGCWRSLSSDSIAAARRSDRCCSPEQSSSA